MFEVAPAFHKVFAVVDGTQVQIDTAAELAHDATGLGRFHRLGVPIELGLGCPIPANPYYHVPVSRRAKQPVAIGPAWKIDGHWTSLAGLSEGLTYTLTIDEQSPRAVRFTIDWEHGRHRVRESYDLSQGRLTLTATCHAAEAMRITVPVLDTDGDAIAVMSTNQGTLGLKYRGGEFLVHHAAQHPLMEEPVANRNGLYRPFVVEMQGETAEVTLELRSLNMGKKL